MSRRVATLIAAFVALLALAAGASPVAAQENVIEIPIDDVEREPEGSVTVLATVDVDPELQGLACTGDAVSSNQESVHPNNDLIVSTGDTSAVIEDVEDVPGATKEILGEVVLGPTLSVSLRMGPDEVFSGGLVVSLDCTGAQQTTTTAPTTEPPATTAAPTTTEPPATTVAPTTAPPPPETSAPAEAETTTTAAPTTAPTTTPPSGSGAQQTELPRTGSGLTGPALAVAAALIATGLALVAWERRVPATKG